MTFVVHIPFGPDVGPFEGDPRNLRVTYDGVPLTGFADGGFVSYPRPAALVVALDFDGTVYAGPFTAADEITGLPNAGAIEWVREELRRGHRLIIHTCRLTTTYEGCPFPVDRHKDPAAVVLALRAWFMLHGLTEAEVDALEFWTRPGKPWANEYLDDRAVRFSGVFPTRAP